MTLMADGGVQQFQTDHDLLVRLDERTSGILKSVEELKKEATLDKDDHEQRIRALEIKIWAISGGFSAASILAGYTLSVFF